MLNEKFFRKNFFLSWENPPVNFSCRIIQVCEYQTENKMTIKRLKVLFSRNIFRSHLGIQVS